MKKLRIGLPVLIVALAAGHLITTGKDQPGISGWLIPAAQAESRQHSTKPAAIFQKMRASSVYVNPPELARFGYSNAVVVNNWTGFKQLDPVSSGSRDGDMGEQAHAALKQLQQMLDKLDIPQRHILGLDVYFEGSHFDDVMAISEVLEGFFASRTSYKTNPPELVDMPVRNIFGVKNLSERYGKAGAGAKVVLVPTVLDPKTTTDERLANPSASPARRDGKATFLIGGVMSQNLGFTLSTEEQPQAALNNLDSVLRSIGASRGDIERLKVSYVASSGLTTDSLQARLNDFFDGAVPEVEWVGVDLAGFASNDTCVEAFGSIRILTP